MCKSPQRFYLASPTGCISLLPVPVKTAEETEAETSFLIVNDGRTIQGETSLHKALSRHFGSEVI